MKMKRYLVKEGETTIASFDTYADAIKFAKTYLKENEKVAVRDTFLETTLIIREFLHF